MELSNEILKLIKSDKDYEEILKSYDKIQKLIKKGQIGEYAKIKDIALNLEKQLEEIGVGEKPDKAQEFD